MRGATPHVQRRSREGAGLAVSALFAVAFVVTSSASRRMEFSGSGFADMWPAGGLPIIWLLVRQGRSPGIDSALVLARVVRGQPDRRRRTRSRR